MLCYYGVRTKRTSHQKCCKYSVQCWDFAWKISTGEKMYKFIRKRPRFAMCLRLCLWLNERKRKQDQKKIEMWLSFRMHGSLTWRCLWVIFPCAVFIFRFLHIMRSKWIHTDWKFVWFPWVTTLKIMMMHCNAVDLSRCTFARSNCIRACRTSLNQSWSRTKCVSLFLILCRMIRVYMGIV